MRIFILRFALVGLVLLFAPFANAGTWTLEGADQIRFSGYVMPGDVESFLNVWTPQVKRIVVDSGGGDALTGSKLGLEIYKRNLDVIVEGLCPDGQAKPASRGHPKAGHLNAA